MRFFLANGLMFLFSTLFANQSYARLQCVTIFDKPGLSRRALRFAKKEHGKTGVKRKFDGKPYIVHPTRVAKRLKKLTNDEEILAAAYLHDLLEDTSVTYSQIKSRFGKRVADLVRELTTDPAELLSSGSKAQYLAQKMSRMSTDALLIKLADRLDNVSDFEKADPSFLFKYKAETELLLSTVKKRPDLNSQHQSLITDIELAMKLGENLHRGRIFAYRVYAGEKRKYTEDDYFTHPSRVSAALARLGVEPEVRIAAYLKDALEVNPKLTYLDIKKQFGSKVADLVFELTKNDIFLELIGSRSDYIRYNMTHLSDNALLIRLAGRYDNLLEIADTKTAREYKQYIEDTYFMVKISMGVDREFSDLHLRYLTNIRILLERELL